MAAMPSAIGRYKILQRLGQGGMGLVYLARDPQLDRQVAIKLLQQGFDSADLRARFAREAKSVARLRHINIVSVYDIGTFEDAPSSWSMWPAKAWPTSSPSASRCRSGPDSRSSSRCAGASRTRIEPASCTATSSRRIFSSETTASLKSSIS